MAHVLELREVTAGYGATTVLRRITVAVPAGSVVALLGPNGAGKTTLLRVASGLLTPSAGAVVLDGRDVTGLSPDRLMRRGLCHVPEGRGVFPNLSVRENLLTFGLPGHRQEAIEQAISAFPRLGQRLNQTAGTLSGGEQQQLALSRAYVQNPRFILLDEVSMGLAPKVVDEVFAFLRALAERGAALLLVEQYVARALQVADSVYLLGKGEVTFAGECDEVEASALAASTYLGI
jgi:branched-chain amino acid transport system ATP-binding protein